MMAPIIIAAFSLVISVMTFIYTWVFERRRNTVNAYIDLQLYLDHFNEYSDNELETFLEYGTEEYKALSNSLAQIEIFSAAVRKGIYARDVVYELSHGYLDGVLRNSIEYIVEMKQKIGEEFLFQYLLAD